MNFTGTQRMSMAVRTKFHDRFLVKCKKNQRKRPQQNGLLSVAILHYLLWGDVFHMLVCDCCFPTLVIELKKTLLDSRKLLRKR